MLQEVSGATAKLTLPSWKQCSCSWGDLYFMMGFPPLADCARCELLQRWCARAIPPARLRWKLAREDLHASQHFEDFGSSLLKLLLQTLTSECFIQSLRCKWRLVAVAWGRFAEGLGLCTPDLTPKSCTLTPPPTHEKPEAVLRSKAVSSCAPPM